MFELIMVLTMFIIAGIGGWIGWEMLTEYPKYMTKKRLFIGFAIIAFLLYEEYVLIDMLIHNA